MYFTQALLISRHMLMQLQQVHQDGRPSQQPPVGLYPRQNDQVDEGVAKETDRECTRTDPDGPLSEALTGCNQE